MWSDLEKLLKIIHIQYEINVFDIWSCANILNFSMDGQKIWYKLVQQCILYSREQKSTYGYLINAM